MKSAELKSESISKRQERATPFYAVHSHKLARHSSCRPAGSPKKFCRCSSAGFGFSSDRGARQAEGL